MYRKAAIALLAITAALSGAAESTQRITATKANEYALVYTLPVTGLRITLEAQITVKQPGEFYEYARKYLNEDNPISRESRTAALKSAVVQTYGVPDPEQRFLVTVKNANPYMILTESGIPLAFNTSTLPQMKTPELPVAREAEPTPLQKPAARQVITEEMLQSQSVAKRAELAAQQIFEIRQARADLVSGNADTMPPDGKSLELMLQTLQAQEEALEAMFCGTTSTYTEVKTVDIMPEDDITDAVIARISAVDGFVDPDNLSGAPVYLSLKVTQEGEMPVNDKGEPLPVPKNGLAYCIPGQAQVSITDGDRTYCDTTLDLAQFGIVYALSPNTLTDKKTPSYVIFNPATGAFLKSGPVEE